MTLQAYDVINVVVTSRVLCILHLFCISIQSQHKFKFVLTDNIANISRNKVARAKVLEFIDHPSYVAECITSGTQERY